MPDYSDSRTSGPSLWVIERPRCPKCQTRMSLARISPGPSGHEFFARSNAASASTYSRR
jgi:hypothetical protein